MLARLLVSDSGQIRCLIADQLSQSLFYRLGNADFAFDAILAHTESQLILEEAD